MTLTAICGSLSANSANLVLLQQAQAIASNEVRVFDGIGAIPHFNPDIGDGPTPAEVTSLRQSLASATGVLIACPEYGHSLPGALKNALDWVIGSGELYRKPVAITAAVRHPERGKRGLDALCTVLEAVDAVIVWNAPIVISEAEVALPALLSALEDEPATTGTPR